MMVPSTHIRLLGTPTIAWPGRESVRLERKASALLFLAVRRPATSRASAAALLWPDVSASVGRTNLRVTTHRLNRMVGCRLFTESDVLELVECTDDLSHILHRSLSRAAALEVLSTPLLDGFRFDDCSDMSALIEQTQIALYEHAEREVHRHGQELAAAGDVQAADVTFLSEAFAIRPLAERIASELMELLLRLGDRAAALAIYERLRNSMIQELGVSPSPETQRLHARMLQAATTGRQRDERFEGRLEERADFRLVERETLLERLWQTAASGRHILIEGEAGLGKSRLVREFARAYRKACIVRLRPGDEQQSYSLMRQLVFHLRDMLHLTQFPPALRYFARIDVGRSRDPDSLGAVEDIGAALLRTLVVARQAGLEILVVDDCHEIDGSSAAILASLFGKLEQPRRDIKDEVPTLIFAGRGAAPNRVSTKLWYSCRSSECWQHIELEAITATGVAQMMDQTGLTSEQIGLTNEELQRRTGGNPFFVAELLREASWGRALTSKWMPGAVSALFRQRIATLSEEGFFVLEIAHCAGSDFEPAMVEEVRHWKTGNLLHAWNELRRVGLFGATGFAHDLARAATEAELSGPARHQLHRQIAKYLQTYALPERVAHHLILGGLNSDALPLAVTAARRLVLEYSFREALTLLENALQKGAPDESSRLRSARFAAICLMAHCLTALDGPASHIKRMVATLSNLANTPAEELIAECWMVQALVEDPMLPGAATVVARDRPGGDSVWCWSLQVMHCYAWVLLRELEQAARILPRAPVRSDEACWEFGLHSFGKYTLSLVGLGRLSEAEAFQSSHSLPSQMSYLRCSMRSTIANERGDLHSAVYWTRELLAGFAKSHQDIPRYRVAVNILQLAFCELRRGKARDARDLLETIADDGPSAFRNDRLLAQAILAATEGDDLAYRRARIDTQLDGDPDVFLHVYWIEVRRAMNSGEIDRAEKTFLEGLQKVCELNSISCSAYRLLGGRFEEPAVALAMAENVLNSIFNHERFGLRALAQLEIARASLRLNDVQRAERALLEMHELPFLGFANILLPAEFLRDTVDAVEQCKRKSLSKFAMRLKALTDLLQATAASEQADHLRRSRLDEPQANA